ncbi:MAG: hypothetical protein NTX22_17170 [Ignavibacteriales bacterium]|nr:hypothetical protein [Ignavibacteriales bacterium]
MNKKFYYLILIFCLPLFNFAQTINGRFSSSIYSFERFESADVSNTYLRSYQTLNLNVNKDFFSLRSYFTLEGDLSKNVDNDPRLRFYNLYLETRKLFDVATIKLGRQPLFNSVAGGVFDGITADLRYSDYKITGYYGGNVPAYQKLELTKKWKDDYIYGGKFTINAFENWKIGLSYVNKNFRIYDYWATRLDENLNPISVLVQSKSNQYKFASAEVSYESKNFFNIDTRYDFDFNLTKTSKVEFNGRYMGVKDLGVDVYYNYREPRVRYNSIFSVFDYGNSQEIETGLDYKLGAYTVLGKFGYVKYKDDNSERVTVGVNSPYGNISYRKTFGYAGELDAVSLYAANTFFDGLVTPSAGVTFTTYKLTEADPRNDLVTILGNVNVRPWRVLSFDIQGQYLNNKIYKNDFRFFLKLNYWFNTNLNLI